MNSSKGKERWIHCYKSSQNILLVGDGDFSFSACLARAFRSAENMVATSYLDRNSLDFIHWTSLPHLEELKSLGCLLLYNVDVYKMHTHPKLKNMKFDIIIFNFPHAGHYVYLCERDQEVIGMHINLVEAYFKSASKMLTEGGEVHLRHREDPPYDSWNVVSLAAKAGLTLKEKVFFNKSDYPGYHNKRGGGINTNKTFPIICEFTYMFVPYLPKVVDHHCGKDIVNDHVDVSKTKEADHVNNKFPEDKVVILQETDEVNDDLFVQKVVEVHPLKNGVDLPYSDIVVDLDLRVLEMVGEDLLKKDDQVHSDLELLKVIDHGDLLEKDKVNADFDLSRLVDDYDKKNELIQKFDKMHFDKNDDDDHDFPENDELYVLEMKQDLHQHKVHDDDQHLAQKDDEAHVDSKLELDGSARLKTEYVGRSGIICNFCIPAEWLLTWFES